MVECGGIVAASEQWLRLVMYEGRRSEAQKDIVVVVILSGVTVDDSTRFNILVSIRRGFWGWELMLDSQYKEGKWKMHVHVVDKIMVTKKSQKNDRDLWD